MPRTLLVVALIFAMARGAIADPAADRQAICQAISDAASENGLPAGYLARLLWAESRFRSMAISRAGAEGVAQFMPGTAARRGLVDPLAPLPSIQQAARLLVELDRRFGNLGLAAAAYNAGADRVAKWLQGVSVLPAETRLYVAAITGRAPEDWAWLRNNPAMQASYSLPGLDCLTVTARAVAVRRAPGLPAPNLPPAERRWQARLDDQLAAAAALLGAAVPREPAPLTAEQRHAFDALCGLARAKGASCEIATQ